MVFKHLSKKIKDHTADVYSEMMLGDSSTDGILCSSQECIIQPPEEIRKEILNLLNAIPDIDSEDYHRMLQKINNSSKQNIN